MSYGGGEALYPYRSDYTGAYANYESGSAPDLVPESLIVNTESLGLLVADFVHAIVGRAVPSDQPLMEAGIDSLGATELQQKLADELGVELPSTLVFDYPTVDAITNFLAQKVSIASFEGQAQYPIEHLVPRSGLSSRTAALLSASGQCGLCLQQWKAGDAISQVPYNRWDTDASALNRTDGEVAARFGVFMADVEFFDPETFGIMRSEAFGMDPQQRLLLQVALEAFVAAGGTQNYSGKAAGAFVGIAATDYESLSHRNGVPINSFSFTAASPSVASGRLAYGFGLQGPAVSVDTACSASLVAVHMACTAFIDSPLDAALAAGVLLCLVPESTLMLHRAQMLSPEGRSKALDASADGYVRGEACRAVVLRPASKFVDTIAPIGFILGSAVNTNGRSSSLTAPNGPAQQLLLREAWFGASIHPADVHGLQLHCNGTILGDPIEIGALSAVALVSLDHI